MRGRTVFGNSTLKQMGRIQRKSFSLEDIDTVVWRKVLGKIRTKLKRKNKGRSFVNTFGTFVIVFRKTSLRIFAKKVLYYTNLLIHLLRFHLSVCSSLLVSVICADRISLS